MKTKRTEITIETERLLVVSSPRQTVDWCSGCGARVQMLPINEAALVARTTARTVFGWVEAERVHFRETDQGSLLICLDSLSTKHQPNT
jgi:hypothetical protein